MASTFMLKNGKLKPIPATERYLPSAASVSFAPTIPGSAEMRWLLEHLRKDSMLGSAERLTRCDAAALRCPWGSRRTVPKGLQAALRSEPAAGRERPIDP